MSDIHIDSLPPNKGWLGLRDCHNLNTRKFRESLPPLSPTAATGRTTTGNATRMGRGSFDRVVAGLAWKYSEDLAPLTSH
jgi:hypothetical protein